MTRQTKLAAPDMWTLGTVLALVVLGLVLVFDASYARTGGAQWAGYDTWYFVRRQLVFVALGLVAMLLTSRMSLSWFIKITTPLLILAIGLLVAVLVFGKEVNGAKRWLQVGPFNVQVSEVAKLALVLYLAGVLARRKQKILRITTGWIMPAGFTLLIAGLIFVEPDLGTTIAVLATVFTMLCAAGVRKRHLMGMLGTGALACYVAIKLEPYRLSRIKVWLDPWTEPYGSGYQIVHSLVALGTGGLRGVGLCEGREKLYLPAASTDYILSTLGEEAGLIGCLVVLTLFMILTYRGLDIARRSKSSYGNLLAVGVTSVIAWQAIINVAVVTNAIPATGLPLPFISYGGSSIVAMMAAAGILLSASRHVGVNVEEQDLYENSFDGWRDGRAYISRNKRRTSAQGSGSRRRIAVHR